MGDMSDYEIEQSMRVDMYDYYPRGDLRPIWTDKAGKEYWRYKEISDNHLKNIINLMERNLKNMEDKKYRKQYRERYYRFRREMKKREDQVKGGDQHARMQ